MKSPHRGRAAAANSAWVQVCLGALGKMLHVREGSAFSGWVFCSPLCPVFRLLACPGSLCETGLEEQGPALP